MNVHIDTIDTDLRPLARRDALLMCAPHHFGVDYIINPWMENQIGRADVSRARGQWENLRQRLDGCADIALVAPEPGLPDMVFTANAGLVIEGRAVVSRFHARERRRLAGSRTAGDLVRSRLAVQQTGAGAARGDLRLADDRSGAC
jgi:hypothetical protein